MRELRIGLFLGLRQIQRANKWVTFLIVMVILFTFINLAALSGILAGIVDGATRDVKEQSMADLIIFPLDGEERVKESYRLTEELKKYHEIEALAPRYSSPATIEANYEERRNLASEPDIIATRVYGIDVEAENQATKLQHMMGEGEFLQNDESGYILLGKYNVERYAEEFGDLVDSLSNIYPGDEVLVTSGDQAREFTVKGIVDSKVDMVAVRVYMNEQDFRRMFSRADFDAEQIVVKLKPGYTSQTVRDRIEESDLTELANVSAFEDEVPKFVADVRDTFNLLGLIVGFVGIIVASITIFIIIFINALSHRQQIGILKAIGITRRTIEYAYVTQALVYSLIGSTLGILITQFGLIPYFAENPIDFPFADISLGIDLTGMLGRALALVAVSALAGFVPVWMIARKNTLDSILGRN